MYGKTQAKPRKLRRWLIAMGIPAILLFAGCSAPWDSSPSTRRSTTPSATPQPVQVTVTATQQGTVEANTLQVITTIVVSSHRSATIGIMQMPGYDPQSVQLRIDTAAVGAKVWDNAYFVSTACDFGCPPPADIATLHPRGSQTWTVTVDPYHPPRGAVSHIQGSGLQAGAKYLIVATVHWHTGAVSAASAQQPTVVQASGQTQITLTK